MSSLLGSVLQCRRLNSIISDKKKNNVQNNKYEFDVYKNLLSERTRAIMKQQQHQQTHKTTPRLLNSSYENAENKKLFSKASKQKIICLESKIRKTIHRRVHYRHMESGSVEFIEGPVLYSVRKSTSKKIDKKPMNLVFNTSDE